MGSFFAPKSGFLGENESFILTFIRDVVLFLFIAIQGVNSKIEVLDKLSTITGIKPIFYEIDVTDEAKVEEIFINHKIDGVIHFAGLKAVGESVSKPIIHFELMFGMGCFTYAYGEGGVSVVQLAL